MPEDARVDALQRVASTCGLRGRLAGIADLEQVHLEELLIGRALVAATSRARLGQIVGPSSADRGQRARQETWSRILR